MYGKYERDAAMPGGDVLAALAKLGIDIYYILVGQHQNDPQQVALGPDEVALIDGYRSLSDELQESVRLQVDGLVELAARKGISKSMRKKKADKK